MARQKAKAKKKGKPIGFYTEDGKTKSIFAPKEGEKVVKKVPKERYAGERKAQLKFRMETEEGP
jgi:hypothetical protein